MPDSLDIEDLKRKIDEYFDNVSDEQFEKDIKEAMNSICPVCGDYLAKDWNIELWPRDKETKDAQS